MNEPATISLFHYWNRLRANRPAPRRAEVEPADIKALLSDTFILERDSRGEAIFRLAGTHLCAVHGRELKGFVFASLWRARDQALVSRFVDATFSAAGVGLLTVKGRSQKNRACSFEMLLLPLDGGVQHPRCLGVASALARPAWLGADPIVEVTTESVRALDPDREPLFLANRPALDLSDRAPPASIPSPASWPARRVRHLTVFEGGRGGQATDCAGRAHRSLTSFP